MEVSQRMFNIRPAPVFVKSVSASCESTGRGAEPHYFGFKPLREALACSGSSGQWCFG